MENLQETLQFIHGLNRFGTKLGLANITNLLELLGNPHEDLKIIHVAGTNGKGSTCAMIDSILREEGYNVGLFTSPYLEVFNERMRVNGENISDKDLIRITNKVKEKVLYMREQNIGSPTEFEVVTAIGFCYFKEQGVDFTILEVGMGGRLDATNVVTPMVSVITPISFDHQQYLGASLADIAREKCGIIKPDVPVVSGTQASEALEVIVNTSKAKGCTIIVLDESGHYTIEDKRITYEIISQDKNGSTFLVKTPYAIYKNLKIGLLGTHQVQNAATAVGTIDVLRALDIKITERSLYRGLEKARWAGRFEILQTNPLIIIDGAHNIAGIKSLKDTICKHYSGKREILVLGMLKDKDYNVMIKEIAPLSDTIITTVPENPRALTAKELAEAILKHKDPNTTTIYEKPEIADAIKLAYDLAGPDDIVIFAGSLYMIGTVRHLIKTNAIKQISD